MYSVSVWQQNSKIRVQAFLRSALPWISNTDSDKQHTRAMEQDRFTYILFANKNSHIYSLLKKKKDHILSLKQHAEKVNGQRYVDFFYVLHREKEKKMC
jgi:hypothetical protein